MFRTRKNSVIYGLKGIFGGRIQDVYGRIQDIERHLQEIKLGNYQNIGTFTGLRGRLQDINQVFGKYADDNY